MKQSTQTIQKIPRFRVYIGYRKKNTLCGDSIPREPRTAKKYFSRSFCELHQNDLEAIKLVLF